MTKAWFLAAYSCVVSLSSRLLLRTTSKSFVNFEGYRAGYSKGDGMILTFWHNQILAMPALTFGQPEKTTTLVPLSKDGELTSRIARRYRIGVVRGSDDKTGSALTEMLRLGRLPGAHTALTADGPRGPAFTIRDGIITLAQRTGKPVIPLAVAYEKYLQLKSWDGFLIPFPFTKAYFVCGDPVHIPEHLDDEAWNDTRKTLEQAMINTNTIAMAQRQGKTRKSPAAPPHNSGL